MIMEITERPIFVVGPPRSGTSMMQWSLRQHSQLWGGPESDFLVPLLNALGPVHEFGTRRGEMHWLSGQSVEWDEFVGYVGMGINAMYTARSGGLRWVEQTPLYTTALGGMADLFPGAQFLFMVRDGRQVVHSLRNFVNPMEHRQACKTWARYISAGLAFERTEQGGMLHRVGYQDVVNQTENEIKRVCELIDEPFEQAMVDFIRDNAPINSSFSGEVSADKVSARWSTWTADERHEFVEISGDLLLELGFESDHEWVDG